jgi:hypothetical protein
MDVSKEIKKDFACDVLDKMVQKDKKKSLINDKILKPR